MTEKRCYRCKLTKPITDFSRHSKRPGGHRAECKVCARADKKAWYERNREQQVAYRRRKWNEDVESSRASMRAKSFKHYHGISTSEADKLIAEQNGLCGLCGLPLEPRGSGRNKAVYDHCHKTGKHRAMIHSNCNCLLGFAGDSIDLLRKAIVYLEHHAER